MLQNLINKLVPGAIDTGDQIPVGDFTGTWQFQDEKLEEAAQAEKAAKTAAETKAAANGATANGAAAKTEDPKAVAEAKKKEEEAKKAEEKKSSKKKKGEEEIKTEAPVVAVVKPKIDKSRLVKIVLLPLDPADDVGIGMLTFRNITQRFYWEAKGNGKDTWNIQFAKDNNVYTKLTYGFDFTGTLRKSSVGFELSGSLHISNEGKEDDYFLETYRYMYPELVAPAADKAEFALGADIQLNGKYFSSEATENVLKFTEVKSQKQFEAPVSSVRTEDSENNVLTIMADKKWAKGEYQVFLTRAGEYKSNTITIKLK